MRVWWMPYLRRTLKRNPRMKIMRSDMQLEMLLAYMLKIATLFLSLFIILNTR